MVPKVVLSGEMRGKYRVKVLSRNFIVSTRIFLVQRQGISFLPISVV